METLYIALVDTPGLFSGIIRRVIGIDYCHVVLSLDANFEHAYSFNRRNPAIPWFSGFVREDSEKILRKFPTAWYKVMSISCTAAQKRHIRQTLEDCYQRRRSLHYCVVGLPFLLFGKPFYQKNRYTCSSFIAKLLEEHGIPLFQKDFSLVTPRDFYELTGTRTVYEGPFGEYVDNLGPEWKVDEVYVA